MTRQLFAAIVMHIKIKPQNATSSKDDPELHIKLNCDYPQSA